MANLQLIKELAAKKNITLDQLSKNLGITPQALSKIMRENSTKIDTLERIASELGVSPSVFFETESLRGNAVALDHSISLSGNHSTITPTDEATTKEFISLLKKRDEQVDRMLDMMQQILNLKPITAQ